MEFHWFGPLLHILEDFENASPYFAPFLQTVYAIEKLLVGFTLLYVHSSIAIILMGKRELMALLNLSSWCLVMVERLFLAVPRGCLRFVIVVFPDHTHLLFLMGNPELV